MREFLSVLFESSEITSSAFWVNPRTSLAPARCPYRTGALRPVANWLFDRYGQQSTLTNREDRLAGDEWSVPHSKA